MCGRTACTLAPDDIPKKCKFRGKNGKIQQPQWRDGTSGQYYPSHNISPQSYTPVMVSAKHISSSSDEDAPERILQSMKWGLLPSWYKGNPKEFSYNMSNARQDTLLDKRSFKVPLEKGKRCVVLAEGFFEWHAREKGSPKQPYYIYFKNDEARDEKHVKAEDEEEGEELQLLGQHKQLLTMAGLFDCWKAPKSPDDSKNELLYSYTIITVDSSQSFGWLHNRMPAVLDGEEEIRQWLDYEELPWKKALKLLTPKECLQWHPVSTVVNNSRNKTPDCIKPIGLSAQKEKKPEKGTLLTWFKPSPKKDKKARQSPEEEEPSPKKKKFE